MATFRHNLMYSDYKLNESLWDEDAQPIEFSFVQRVKVDEDGYVDTSGFDDCELYPDDIFEYDEHFLFKVTDDTDVAENIDDVFNNSKTRGKLPTKPGIYKISGTLIANYEIRDVKEIHSNYWGYTDDVNDRSEEGYDIEIDTDEAWADVDWDNACIENLKIEEITK